MNWKQTFVTIAAIFITFTSWSVQPVLAYDNPDLLPKEFTPIIDLAKTFTPIQEDRLVQDLETFEKETGWKLRVLTQYDRTPGTAVKDYWGLDNKSILVVADSRGGNILNFNVGDYAYQLMPRTFWIELQTRYGNLYYVRENGEDRAILDSLDSIKTCIIQDGCKFVPGLPKEQWILTLITSIIGGVICGFSAIPRRGSQGFAWQWALIFSPLWGILFIAFGIGPVVTRTHELLPLIRNCSGFLIGALVAYLSPMLNQNNTTSET
jgi:energy-converting hydrogenase Eha subunit A